MKKKLLLGLICLLTVGVTCACGKTEEEKRQEAIEKELEEFAEELGMTKEELEAIQNEYLLDEAIYEAERQNRLEEEQEREEEIASYKKYDAVEEWKNVEPYNCAVQIDDQLYTVGCTVNDIMKQIDASEVEYSYDVDLNKSVWDKEIGEITICRGDTEWFRIHCICMSDEETGTLGDSLVTGITIMQVAYPCARFIDGRSYEEILEMTQEDVVALQNSLFTEDLWNYTEKHSTRKKDNESYNVYVDEFRFSDGFANPDLLWTGYDMMIRSDYEFVVSCDSNKVIDFTKYTEYFSYQETPVVQYNSLSEVSEEELAEFVLLAEDILKNNYNAVSEQLEAIYLSEYGGAHALMLSYRITKDDDSEVYANVEFMGAGKKPIGGIGYRTIYDGERELSKGAYEVHDSATRGLLDKIEYVENP